MSRLFGNIEDFGKGLTHGTIKDIKSAAHDPMSDESFAVLNRLNPMTSMGKYGMDVGNKYLGTPTMSHSDMGKLTAATAALLGGSLALGGGAAGGGAAGGAGGAGAAPSAGVMNAAAGTSASGQAAGGGSLGAALKTSGSALGTMNLLQGLFGPRPTRGISLPQGGGIQSNKQNGRLVRR